MRKKIIGFGFVAGFLQVATILALTVMFVNYRQYTYEKILEAIDNGDEDMLVETCQMPFSNVNGRHWSDWIDSIMDGIIKSTPIERAIIKSHPEMVKILVENGASVSYRKPYKEYCLEIAIEFGEVELVKYLVEKGAPPLKHYYRLNNYAQYINHFDGYSLDGYIAIKKELLEYGLLPMDELEIVNHIVSVFSGCDIEVVKYYAEVERVDPQMRFSDGDSLLHKCVAGLDSRFSKDEVEAIKYLISIGADVNALNDQSKTPRDIAVELGLDEIVAILDGK